MIAISSARAIELFSAKAGDNPFVAYQNLAATATLGGTSTLADGSAANAVTGTTADYWLPNVTGTSALFAPTFATATSVSLVAIAAHNLGTLGATVQVKYSTDNISWTDSGVGFLAPTDNSPIVVRMAAASARYWQIEITGLTAGDPVYAGVVFFGNDLVMPMRFYQGFAPVISPTEVELQSNVTVGGNLVGSSIVAKGSTISAPFRLIPPSFTRGDLLPFIPHFNAGKGFFFGWRPETYPQDVHYCWRDGDAIRPTNEGPRDFMAFSINARVYEG